MTEERADGAVNDSKVEGATILVVDDEEVIHHSLKRILGRQGHSVEGVLTARDGLERLEQGRYDLVITDLMMPEVNGIELLQEMNSRGIEVPIVMITGYPTIRTAVQALRLGAVDYMAKPFTRQELLGPVNRAIRRGAEGRGPDSREMIAATGEEGVQAPRIDVVPGDRFYLKEHSWAFFRQDGYMEVGIEASFLGAVGTVATMEVPSEGELVEQGYTGIRLTTTSGEVHGVFMPLSGQVVESNVQALAEPAAVEAGTWLVRILPTALEPELPLLRRRERGRTG